MINNISIDAFVKLKTHITTNRAGQGLVEYGLLIGVLVVAALALSGAVKEGVDKVIKTLHTSFGKV